MIAVRYLSSWLFPDLIAVIPFELFIEKSSVNKLARIGRIGKVYKLVRLAKLTRIIRFIRIQSKMMKQLADLLKIGAGFERIVFLLVSFFIL